MSNPHTLTVDVEPLSLANVGGSELAAQFETCLDQISEAYTHYDERHGGGKLKAKLTVGIDFTLDTETNAVTMKATASVRLPKPRQTVKSAICRGGRFLVEPIDEDGTQLAAFNFHHDRKPTPAVGPQE